MGMTLHWVSHPVSQREQQAYNKEEGWLDAMRSSCIDALANNVLRERAFYRRIDPPEGELHTPVYHQWSIGVECDMDELKARDMQIEEGRRKGLAEAAAICIAAAARYQNQTSDGMCKWVIASALEGAARAIQKT